MLLTVITDMFMYLPGVTLLNTATFYGPLNDVGFGANLRLLKTAIADIDRSKIQLMVKICMNTRLEKNWILCEIVELCN